VVTGPPRSLPPISNSPRKGTGHRPGCRSPQWRWPQPGAGGSRERGGGSSPGGIVIRKTPVRSNPAHDSDAVFIAVAAVNYTIDETAVGEGGLGPVSAFACDIHTSGAITKTTPGPGSQSTDRPVPALASLTMVESLAWSRKTTLRESQDPLEEPETFRFRLQLPQARPRSNSVSTIDGLPAMRISSQIKNFGPSRPTK